MQLFSIIFCEDLIDILCFLSQNFVVFNELLQRIFWDFTRIFKFMMKSLWILIKFYRKNTEISQAFNAIWTRKMWSNLLRFYRVYKISVSVHIYRHRNLQRNCKHFTEIRLTFIKSVNSSNFPVIYILALPFWSHDIKRPSTKDHKTSIETALTAIFSWVSTPARHGIEDFVHHNLVSWGQFSIFSSRGAGR